MAELVDALALGASGVTRESSSLSFRTTLKYRKKFIRMVGLFWQSVFNPFGNQ